MEMKRSAILQKHTPQDTNAEIVTKLVGLLFQKELLFVNFKKKKNAQSAGVLTIFKNIELLSEKENKMRIMSASEQIDLENEQIERLRKAQEDFEQWQRECGCSCAWAVNGLNVGADYFQIETKLEQFDPFCFEHGEPNCQCHWTMAWGDWYIDEYNEDCPVHNNGENNG